MNDRTSRVCGFTLLETLIATVVLVTGIVAIAQVFSYTISTNITNRHRNAATILLVEKLEQFNSALLTDSTWNIGGSLDSDGLAAGFFDFVAIGNDGTLTIDSTSAEAPYLRAWDIRGNDPRSVSVIVYAQRTGRNPGRVELARGSATVSSTF